jgi:hypothetical protein
LAGAVGVTCNYLRCHDEEQAGKFVKHFEEKISVLPRANYRLFWVAVRRPRFQYIYAIVQLFSRMTLGRMTVNGTKLSRMVLYIIECHV